MFGASLIVLSTLVLSWFTWRWANRFFNLPCPFWMDWLMETSYMSRLLSTEETIRRAKLELGHSVLDLGCGSGRISLPASRRVGKTGKILAVDLQKGMMSKLERKVETEGIDHIQTLVCDLDHIDFGNQQFDRIILVMLVGELRNPDYLFQRLQSMLKPNGMISISEVFPDPHYQGKNRIISLAEKNNFKVDEEFGSFFAFTVNLLVNKMN